MLPLDVDNGIVLVSSYFYMFNGTCWAREALSILTCVTAGAGGNGFGSLSCGLYSIIAKALSFTSSSCNLGNNRFTRLILD